MIKAEELRIGNLIYDDFNEVHIVEKIESKKYNDWNGSDPSLFVFSKPIDEYNGMYTCDVVSPIPLTEEWLLKFGFLKDDRKSKHAILSTMYFLGHGLKLWSIINGTRFRHDFNCDYLTGINIDYVHQLQNLVFTLTGEELKLPANEKKTTS